jgi:predicted nucleotide-binding protein
MKKKVLIIEDSPEDFELLKKWARSMDFIAVLPKDHGKLTKAMRNKVTDDFVLKQIKENYKNLALILCDLKHHDNYQAGNLLTEKIREFVIPQMKEWSHRVPIFCVTRYTALLSDSYAKGATGLIDKGKLEADLKKTDENAEKPYEVECRNKINDNVIRFEKYLNDNAIKISGRKVFIVHGHNTEIKTEVCNTLYKLKLKPIVLHEQANLGKTIIEKFEANGNDVGFAIILLTADDLGRLKSLNETENRYRARQNVVFEMGYFMARLSRSHVFILREDGIEEPSDLSGIIYNKISENWKEKLVQELKACDYDVDANVLYR